MREIEGGVCAAEGVSAGGARDGEYGVAVIEGSGAAAGVFTSNRVRAAPVKVTEKLIEGGRLDGVVANSGNANAFTGRRGVEDAEWMAGLLEGDFAVASTGVIGRRIDRERLGELLGRVETSAGPGGSRSAARAVTTTDTFAKEAAYEADGFVVGGLAKGAGMIEPEMGTMLAFLYTDAEVEAGALVEVLSEAVDGTFNAVVVDGETSTNDTALLTATGESGRAEVGALREAVTAVCRGLAEMIAKDGEGSTKLLRCRVEGAATPGDAKRAAKSVLRSPLVKAAFFGGDPNFGRVVAALGHSGARFSEEEVSVSIRGRGRVELARDGEPLEFDRREAAEVAGGGDVTIEVSLGEGDSSASALGCDLSPRYVEINAEYGR